MDLIFALLILVIGIIYITRRTLNQAAAWNRKQAHDLSASDSGVNLDTPSE